MWVEGLVLVVLSVGLPTCDLKRLNFSSSMYIYMYLSSLPGSQVLLLGGDAGGGRGTGGGGGEPGDS